MKFLDRVPAEPNRRRVTDVETGETKSVIIEYDDEPIEEGTPLSAVNFNGITNDIVREVNKTQIGIIRDASGNVLFTDAADTTKHYGSEAWECPDNPVIIDLNGEKTYNVTFQIPVDKAYNYFDLGYSGSYSSLDGFADGNVTLQCTLTALGQEYSGSGTRLELATGGTFKSDYKAGTSGVAAKYTDNGFGSYTDMPVVTVNAVISLTNPIFGSGAQGSGSIYDLKLKVAVVRTEKKAFLNEV